MVTWPQSIPSLASNASGHRTKITKTHRITGVLRADTNTPHSSWPQANSFRSDLSKQEHGGGLAARLQVGGSGYSSRLRAEEGGDPSVSSGDLP